MKPIPSPTPRASISMLLELKPLQVSAFGPSLILQHLSLGTPQQIAALRAQDRSSPLLVNTIPNSYAKL